MVTFETDPVTAWLAIPAVCAYFYNDVLVLISFLGSLVLFLAAFPRSPLQRLVGLAEWSSAPLVFGTIFQIAFLLIGMAPETPKLGILVPMSPWMVTILLLLSWLFMGGRWWMRTSAGGHILHVTLH